jgi:hypothetical protein
VELAKKRIRGIVFEDNYSEPNNYRGNGVDEMATFDVNFIIIMLNLKFQIE